MYAIGLCYEVDNIFDAMKTVENLAMKYSPALKEYVLINTIAILLLTQNFDSHSNIIVYYVNVLRYALLDDVTEMRAACQNLIKIYDGMLNYTTLALALLSSTTLMWYALGLNSELTQACQSRSFY